MGITIPENLFSLKGIFSLVMQVLGLTWDYMRAKAVKLLGEPVVKAMEFGLEMFQIIREKGVEGIWEYIKEQFADLKETIIDSIKDLLIVQVIQAGIKWLVGLLVPGGGFIKAIMAIKDFIVFFVESALMLIPTLIEAIRAMAAGSMSLVANAVEKGLATLLPLVIKLFAQIIGLGGLVGKVQKIIMKIRSRVDKAINKLILKAKKAARKLLNLSKDNGDIHAEENDLVTPQLIAKIDASSEHFTMDGKPHDIYLVYNKGNIEVEMASDFRERLLLKIDNALFEIKDKEGTEWNKLRQNFKSVKDKLNDYEWDISALLDKYHQDTDLTLQKLREQIRSIGQELRIIGDAADIESLKFIGHSSNYVLIDGELDFSHSLFSGLSGGRAIRKKLYPDWSSSIIAWRNKRLSTDYNGGPYGRRDPLDHNNFISEEFGNREPNQFLRRTIKNQNVASVPRSQVSIDHKKSVAYHWENESGKDTNQSKRNTWYNDDKNLRLISGALNSSLGSGGETFDSKVGDKFLGPNE